MFMRLFFSLLLLWHSFSANAKPLEACLRIADKTKLATAKFFGSDSPYWYNIGLAHTETRCRFVISKDGHGSVGYFQLTPKFLDPILRPYFPYYKENHLDHFYASMYYLRILYTQPLWIMYQRYNGGNLVLRECQRASSVRWEDCKAQCRRKDVCVWYDGLSCRQYRNACDINYSYSKKVYQHGQYYKTGQDKLKFW
jgi:hypothetical protein